MGLIIFLVVVGIGCFAAYRLLWPEMYVSLNRPKINFPWRRPRLNINQETDATPIKVEELMPPPMVVDVPAPREIASNGLAFDKINKLETLIFEKNKAIERLQTQLDVQRNQRSEFEKVKEIMDDEIKHLREQLRAFREYHKESSNA